MDSIIDSFIDFGYYRARISTLSDFDKIIGDTLDLGQKIALTERLVMVLLVLKCPYRVEPHQIVGLDYQNLLPVIKWLLKRSGEVRRDQEAFNRLLALRHYHRVTNSLPFDRSKWCHIIKVNHLKKLKEKDPQLMSLSATSGGSKDELESFSKARNMYAEIAEKHANNPEVSFVNFATSLRAYSNKANSYVQEREQSLMDDLSSNISNEDEKDCQETCFTDDDAKTTVSGNDEGAIIQDEFLNEDNNIKEVGSTREMLPPASSDEGEANLEMQKMLDMELLATNQKILNLLRKLDSYPSQLEIRQYQRRYIELHQQLIGKNKDVKKLYDLHNTLDVSRHYLERELNLLESIEKNLTRASDSMSNKESFLKQLDDIVAKIQLIRDDLQAKVSALVQKSNMLAETLDKLQAESID